MATYNFEKIFQARVLNGIEPFTEKPSDNHGYRVSVNYEKIEKRIDATELFSIFTADIIREEVVFTR